MKLLSRNKVFEIPASWGSISFSEEVTYIFLELV